MNSRCEEILRRTGWRGRAGDLDRGPDIHRSAAFCLAVLRDVVSFPRRRVGSAPAGTGVGHTPRSGQAWRSALGESVVRYPVVPVSDRDPQLSHSGVPGMLVVCTVWQSSQMTSTILGERTRDVVNDSRCCSRCTRCEPFVSGTDDSLRLSCQSLHPGSPALLLVVVREPRLLGFSENFREINGRVAIAETDLHTPPCDR